MKTPLMFKERVDKLTFKYWALIVLLVTLALFCLTSGAIRMNDEVQLGTNPTQGSAPAAAPSDSSGASTLTAQTVASSSNPPNSASTSGTQSNPASGPPQQSTHMSTRGNDNMAIRRAAIRSGFWSEPSASSHAFPAVSGSSQSSAEREALEGLLHIDLPDSLGQQQQTTQGEQETVVILDAVVAPRGPGRRTHVGEVKINESNANSDDVRDVLDLVLAMTVPTNGETLVTYDKRVLNGVRVALHQKGLLLKMSIQQRNWWGRKVKFAYDLHKGAGPSTSSTND